MTEERGRNIVLICLDSVRKDYFDDAATEVPRLADVSFEQCRTASSWSAPSYASMITGELPSEHGVHTYSRSYDSVSVGDTLFDDLSEYRTVGISSNVYAGPEFGFDQYFDNFVKLSSHLQYPEAVDPQPFFYRDGNLLNNQIAFVKEALQSDRPRKSLVNGLAGLSRKFPFPDFIPRLVDDGAKAALRTLKREIGRDEPTFIFVSLMEGHIPYEPSRYLDSEYYDCPHGWSSSTRGVWDLCTADEYDEEYWTRRNQLYRASIDYLDRIVAEMVSVVEDVTERETTTIVTADHGDNLGTSADEQLANHKSSLSEGILHVPCYLVNPPVGYDEYEREYFSHLQLSELVVGLAESETPEVCRSRIPAELVGMSAGPEPPSNREFWDRMIRCAYQDKTKIVWDSMDTVERFELDPENPNWQQKVEEQSEVPGWTSELFYVDLTTYKEASKREQERVEVGEETQTRLEELGYI